jgi:hypothetical protein
MIFFIITLLQQYQSGFAFGNLEIDSCAGEVMQCGDFPQSPEGCDHRVGSVSPCRFVEEENYVCWQAAVPDHQDQHVAPTPLQHRVVDCCLPA